MQDGEPWQLPAIAESISGCTNPFLPENRLGPRVLVVRDARHKLILHFDPTSEVLFDLVADPQERSPLGQGEAKAVRRRLLDAARAHLEHLSAKQNAQDRLRLRLRDLQLKWLGPSKAS